MLAYNNNTLKIAFSLLATCLLISPGVASAADDDNRSTRSSSQRSYPSSRSSSSNRYGRSSSDSSTKNRSSTRSRSSRSSSYPGSRYGDRSKTRYRSKESALTDNLRRTRKPYSGTRTRYKPPTNRSGNGTETSSGSGVNNDSLNSILAKLDKLENDQFKLIRKLEQLSNKVNARATKTEYNQLNQRVAQLESTSAINQIQNMQKQIGDIKKVINTIPGVSI